MATYTGTEAAVDVDATSSVEPASIFDVRPAGVPGRAVPIFDDELGAVIGFRDETVTGVYRLYDLEGKVVGMEEKGLEPSPLDPIDLIFFAGGIFRAIGRGIVTTSDRPPRSRL
jgi:hypothetical protein